MIRLRPTMVWIVLCCVLAGCSAAKKAPAARDANPRGGTLRVVIPQGISTISTVGAPMALDPQTEASPDSGEIFRCCLLRGLLSTSGHSTEEGGATLQPDLAAKLPAVSADGLSWTFTLKKGIRYSPPLQNVQVTSADFIRALRREAKLGDPVDKSVFSVIRGFDDFAAGKSDTISGLEAPDPATLIFRLTRPTGDFSYRILISAASPIPPKPSDPAAVFGVATGHDKDGYGSYLVATGPYMLEGSDKLDFSRPAGEQPKALGLAPGRLITLVRNPSWSAASDGLRAAYADRIETRFPSGSAFDVARLTTSGAADVVLDYRPPNDQIFSLARKVHADQSLGVVHVNSRDFVRYISMNLAVPPFDDVHVRKAMNYIVDKKELQRIRGGPFAGGIANHVVFDSMESNLLVAYNPYRTPDSRGDVARAHSEMAKSRYDADHDGVCDADACRDVQVLVLPGAQGPQVAAEIAREVASVGIHVRVEVKRGDELFAELSDPTTQVPLASSIGIGGAYLNTANAISALFSSSQIGASANFSLVGASPAQLRHWGYHVSSVPSIDDRIDACLLIQGSAQIRCWASLDQYVMEQVTPWVPLIFENRLMMTSPRVVAFSYDQLVNEPSLDRIALRPGS